MCLSFELFFILPCPIVNFLFSVSVTVSVWMVPWLFPAYCVSDSGHHIPCELVCFRHCRSVSFCGSGYYSSCFSSFSKGPSLQHYLLIIVRYNRHLLLVCAGVGIGVLCCISGLVESVLCGIFLCSCYCHRYVLCYCSNISPLVIISFLILSLDQALSFHSQTCRGSFSSSCFVFLLSS